MSADRLIFRVHIKDNMGNENDLRVLANEHGLLRIFLMGTARALNYAGIEEKRLPSTVAEGGYTNAAIAQRVRKAIAHPSYKITSEWVEPDQPGHAPLPALDERELASVLAGLRLFAEATETSVAIADIATNCGTLEPLSLDGIDALCARLNLVARGGGRG